MVDAVDANGLHWLKFNPNAGTDTETLIDGAVYYGKYCQRLQTRAQATKNEDISINGFNVYCDVTTDSGHYWRVKLFHPTVATEIDTKEKMIDFCTSRGFTAPGRGVERQE